MCLIVQEKCQSYLYNLLVWSNLNVLHNSQWNTLPSQKCVILYKFCANLLHSLINWRIVSSLSPLNLHLMFSRILSILALIWLVLIAFWASIRKDSVSLLRFPFLSHVHVFSCDMIITIIPFRVFHTSVSCWFLTGVWVTVSYLKSLVFLFFFYWAMNCEILVSELEIQLCYYGPFQIPLGKVWTPQVLFLLFSFFQFQFSVCRNSKFHDSASCFFFFFFLLIITRSGRQAQIRCSDCISKSKRSLGVLLLRTDSWLCIYHLFSW